MFFLASLILLFIIFFYAAYFSYINSRYKRNSTIMSGSCSKITRNKINTKISLYLGGPNNFRPTEFPTLRDCLRRCLDLQQYEILRHDANRRNIVMQKMFATVATEIQSRWSNSNSEFKEPVICNEKAIETRLSRAWSTYSEIARGKARHKTEEEWNRKLDKLFDISYCRCSIFRCGENEAICNELCELQAHCLCKCEAKYKLPKKELLWIKAQREKVGSVSLMQESTLDIAETQKLRKKECRKISDQSKLKSKQDEIQASKQAATSVNPCNIILDSDDAEMEDSSEDDLVLILERPDDCLQRNYLDISSAAMASVRYGVSSTATAAIINGLLADLRRGNHLGEDKKYLICDSKKVFRAKEHVMKTSKSEENTNIEKNSITGIFVDSRKDNTITLKQDESTGTYRKRIIKEAHMSVTEEPKGRYLTHYTPDTRTKSNKPAKQCAIGLYDWIKDRGIDLSLELMGSDTTNEMSGWKGGMLHHVEELLNRRLFRSFCWLHINELPFRHIMTKLDGPTSSDKGWCGSVGKLLAKVEMLTKKTEFEPIPLQEPLVNIIESVAIKMSTDSVLAWKYLQAIVRGKLEPDVAGLKCGQLSHSRWLTCGIRCLMLYMSEHDLGDEETEVLKLLTTWVTQVYLPMFFEIKIKHTIEYGSWHLLKLFRLWRTQDARVREASKPYLRSESWWAHPENLLVALLCSDDAEHRSFAVNIIVSRRDGSEIGSTAVRPYKVPITVNLDANDLRSVIDWQTEIITEPVFTAKLSLSQLNSLKESALKILPYSLHTQSCERVVKLVTEAAESVCGWAKRDGFIRTQMRHRESMPSLRSKKDFLKVFE